MGEAYSIAQLIFKALGGYAIFVLFPLLFSLGWLVCQHAFGFRQLVRLGLYAFVSWLIVTGLIAVGMTHIFLSLIGGHNVPDSYETYLVVGWIILVVWVFGIIPFLVVLGIVHKKKQPSPKTP